MGENNIEINLENANQKKFDEFVTGIETNVYNSKKSSDSSKTYSIITAIIVLVKTIVDIFFI